MTLRDDFSRFRKCFNFIHALDINAFYYTITGANKRYDINQEELFMYNDDEKKAGNIGSGSASSGNYDTPNNDALNTPPSGGGQPEQTVSKQAANESPPNGTRQALNGPQPNGVQQAPNYSQQNNTQHVQGSGPPNNQQTGKEVKPNAYYEPWQQPVYRAPGQTYSPGLNTGSHNDYQRSAPTPPPPPPVKKKKRSGGFAKAVVLVLVCALASAGATYGVLQYDEYYGDDDQNVNQVVLGSESSAAATMEAAEADETPAATSLTSTGQEMSAEDIYDMAVNQVVGVNSETQTNVFGQETTSAVSGTGFIISEDGYILTNYHVIEYAVNYAGYTLTVMMYDGTSYPAAIVGYEEDNDIAVIKIDAEGLSVVTIGDTEEMEVGDTIYTVGNPLGELDYTMTSGIVSALDRVIQVDSMTSINMFQIDAAVNSGNSGGPVYNAEGEVIGIVSAKYASTGVEGLGFAIPINDAIEIATELITNGFVSGKPSMGITVKDWSSGNAQYYGTPVGALVDGVKSGSAADIAGVQVGDIIIQLGDTEITSTETLLLAKKQFNAGETASIVVYRDGEELTLSITFDEEGITSTASTTTTTTNPQKSQSQPSLAS